MSLLQLYLASASPRRHALLRQAGFSPHGAPQSLDESPRPDERPSDLVRRLAQAKARAAAPSLCRRPAGVILAADTAVVLDDRVLGKPRDAADAARMLALLRGRDHAVITGVCLLRTDDGRSTTEIESTRVRFRDFDEAMLRAYAASGEPLDKAGAYGIQGRGVLLAEEIEGSWNNVVGLPVERLATWLARIGVDVRELTDWID